jgi:phosphate transport system substrate-binding protein
VRTLALTFVALLLAGCGGSGSGSSGTNGGVLVGAGSTFVYPLVTKWIQDYAEKKGVTITYGPIGSGGGIQQITNRTVDFGASDAPLTPDQASACKNCLQIPWALAGTSIPYNVPGAPKHLKLTGAVLADMFLGKIKTWNDPAMAKLNPGAKLPAVAGHARVPHGLERHDVQLSRTTSRASARVEEQGRHGNLRELPRRHRREGKLRRRAALSRAQGAITYIDAAYSIQNGFSYASLQNRAGKYTLPDRAAVAAAASTLATVPPDNAVSIVDPPASAPAAYPLSTFTYAIVPQTSPRRICSSRS